MERARLWLSNIWGIVKKPLIWSVSFLGLLAVILVLTYRVPGSGFGQYEVTKIDPATNNLIEIEVHYRTLWDWLELLVIPGFLAIIAFVFNRAERDRDHIRELDRQRENALNNYYDQIERLISTGLEANTSGNQLLEIARGRSLSTLRMLDGYRKGLLFMFLYDIGLITSNPSEQKGPLISLKNADLSGLILGSTHFGPRSQFGHPIGLNGIDLSEADLRKAKLSDLRLYNMNFSGANLSAADLKNVVIANSDLTATNLNHSNLSNAYLTDCSLINCNLSNANLSFAKFDSTLFYSTDFADPESPYRDFTDFTRANINQSIFLSDVHPDQLRKARIHKGTALPGGSVYDGRFSLFTVAYEPDPSKENINRAHPGMGFRKKIVGYCECGRKIEPLNFQNIGFLGLWFGLVKHRIYFHGHFLREHREYGGRDFKGIIDKLTEDEEKNQSRENTVQTE